MFIHVLVAACFALSPTDTASYADHLLDTLAQEVRALEGQSAPVPRLLLAERIYYLGHESGKQDAVVALIQSLYDGTDHQEARAEIGFFLCQYYRQLGRYDAAAKVIRDLGYVSAWRVLGPLAPSDAPDLKDLVRDGEVKGLDRTIKAHDVPAYGTDDFWSLGMGHYGYFNTNTLVYPNQLAGVLHTTWFHLDRETDVRLGLGWSHTAKVWINRTQILDETANQDAHPDQRNLYVTLKKGTHALSIYVASAAEEPNLGIFARLTTADGRPIATTTDGGTRLSRKKPVLRGAGETALVAAAKAQSPYAHGAVILLKEQTQLDPAAAPKDLFHKALAEDGPSRLLADKLLSLTEDPNERWAILTRLVDDGDPSARLDRAWAFSQLGQIALGQSRFWEARKYAGEALAAYPDYWPAQVLENNALSNLSLDGQALRNTLALAERYPGVPWLMMDLSDLYEDMDFREEARRATEDVLRVRGSTAKFAERKIKSLKRAGDISALDRYYADLLRDSPYSVGTAVSYAQFLTVNGRMDKAEKLLGDYLAVSPENPVLLENMGELKLRMNDRREALVFLEQALALRPQNPDLEKLIAFTRSEETGFYAPYVLEQAAPVDVKEISPIVINIDNRVVKVSPNGQSSVFHQLEWQIMDEQGVSDLPGYSFSYAPLRQTAEVVRAEIQRGDRVIHMTRFGRARISDPAYRMYYDLVAYQVAFPPLEIGDIVRVDYRIDDTGATNIFGDYFGDLQYFSDRYPARTKSYTLIMPRDRAIHYHVEKMKPEFSRTDSGDNTVFTWSLNQVSPYETESRMPGPAGYQPYVAVSTFNDWQNMASWYATLIRDQLVLDSETRARVKTLTKGLDNRLDIVKKIHEYVVTQTRYVALEFGIHGYKPYQVNQVCARQFGDCKDKASLIVAMLREAGIPAQVAIVRTVDKGYVHTYPAMLAYFNHAIAYVPEFDLYLDGTAEFSGINELPAMDQGALTLLVDENGTGKLTKIPISDNNVQNYELAFKVRANGATDVDGSLSYNGVATPSLREYLSIETKLAQNLQNLMRETLPGLDVLEADREGHSINEPITLHFTGRTSQLMKKKDGSLSLPLRILGDQLTQAYAANATRRFPIDFGVPKTRNVALTVDAPEGYRLDGVPEALELEDENIRLSLKVVQNTPGSCRINYQVAFKKPRVEPDAYPDLRKLFQEHDRVLDQSLRFVAP